MAVHWKPNVRLIDEARLRRLWSLRRLATESGVSYPTILSLYLGRTRPNFVTLDRIANALQLRPTDLIEIHPGDSRESL